MINTVKTTHKRRRSAYFGAVFRCTALFAGLLLAGPALAGSLQISPILIDVKAPQKASLITLINVGETPMTLQLRLFQWSQSNNDDQLTQTNAVVASPPVVKVAPGSRQVARLIRVAQTPVNKEESYRVLVDQLPDDAFNKGINVLLRYSVPVFFSPGKLPYKPQINAVTRATGDNMQLTISNSGPRRVRLSNIHLNQNNKQPLVFAEGLLGYVLPGSTRTWDKTMPAGWYDTGAGLTLQGRTEAGDLHVPTSPSPAP